MPVYEYVCLNCKKKFSETKPISAFAPTRVRCPKCKSKKLKGKGIPNSKPPSVRITCMDCGWSQVVPVGPGEGGDGETAENFRSFVTICHETSGPRGSPQTRDLAG